MIRRILLIASLCIVFNVLHSQDTQTELFAEANRAFKQENYDQAIKLYSTILEQDFISEELYYNLGTAQLKENLISDAILNLNRCVKLNARHKQAINNLNIARGLVKTEISAIPEFFLARYWKNCSQLFSSTIWAILGLIFAIGFAISFYYWLIPDDRQVKKRAFFVGLSALASFVIISCAGYSKLNIETSQEKAVLMTESELYSGADDRSEVLLQLTPGVEFTVTDQIGEFYKVLLMDKEVGWIKKTMAELI